MNDVIVYVLAQKRGNDIYFRMAADTYGLSGPFVEKDCAEIIGGNPYLLYRKAILYWIGHHLPTQPEFGSTGFSIVVLQPTSGSIVPYEEQKHAS